VRSAGSALVASVGALLLLAAPAGADSGPLQIWSLSAVEQGVGKVPLAGDAQPSGALDRSVDLGRVALHPHGFGDHARYTANGAAIEFALMRARP
jgi:hypothetical protein